MIDVISAFWLDRFVFTSFIFYLICVNHFFFFYMRCGPLVIYYVLLHVKVNVQQNRMKFRLSDYLKYLAENLFAEAAKTHERELWRNKRKYILPFSNLDTFVKSNFSLSFN